MVFLQKVLTHLHDRNKVVTLMNIIFFKASILSLTIQASRNIFLSIIKEHTFTERNMHFEKFSEHIFNAKGQTKSK